MTAKWDKSAPESRVWWKETPGVTGELIFSFDKKKEYSFYRDFPEKLTPEELKIFREDEPVLGKFREPDHA
ncbi:MAG TPA: hypothetical protein DHV71_01700 [Acidaminococcaceae bacterium]|jgi:hypothetical protein|nr:hypothetical protein [Succiniclasticum sp.]MEE3480146.1 hypothetical protein [Succiniclasticum sp.]HCJ90592.1 hypothetical protein [Acidaminococcaceae bacterium]